MPTPDRDKLGLFEEELRRQAETPQIKRGSQPTPDDVAAFQTHMRHQVARKLALTGEYSFTEDFVSDMEENWGGIREQYRGRPDVRMLEIGSFQGRSTVWFLENVLTHPSSAIVCIDLFEWGEARFDHNIRVSGFGSKVTKLKGNSQALLPALAQDRFDVIYVDGDHRAANVLIDGVLSWSMLKSGGCLIFDDYLWKMEKAAADRPQMAIDLFLEAFAGEYELLLRDYQVILRKYS